MKVLFATSSLGLGHATRDLPLIHALQKEGHEVVSLSTGRALQLLKREAPDCQFLDIPDYPLFFTQNRMSVSRLLALSPRIFSAMHREHVLAEKLRKKYDLDMIVTDGRYGAFSKHIPSYWVSHQLRFISPGRFFPAELGAQFMHTLVQKNFVNVLVPDYEDESLSGDLSHNLRFMNKSKLNYLGVLSQVQKRDVKQDVDFFVSLTGGVPSGSSFERSVLSQLHKLPGKVVVTRGLPEAAGRVEERGHATIYGHLDREQQSEMMNRAKFVVCRSGYTTLMELAELNKRGYFVPTPGATEQQYLAKFHREQGTFDFASQKQFCMQRLQESMHYSGVRRKCRTKDSVKRFMDAVA